VVEAARRDVRAGSVPSLIHAPTGSEFVFDFEPQYGQHCAVWSPGEQRPTDKANAGSDGWPFMLHVLGIWLENVKRERSSPNLGLNSTSSENYLRRRHPAMDKATGRTLPSTPRSRHRSPLN